MGAAANYDDSLVSDYDQKVISPSKASALAAEAITMNLEDEDDEQSDLINVDDKKYDAAHHETQFKQSGTAEKSLKVPIESSDPEGTTNQEFGNNSSASIPGYVPSEQGERILFELSSSMVRPLKVLRGMFQVSYTLRLCRCII